MAYTRNPLWVDGRGPSETRIDAADLNNIEDGLVAAASIADSALAGLASKVNISDAVSLSSTAGAAPVTGGYAGTANTAARGDHAHPLQYGQPYPLLGTGGDYWTNPLGTSSAPTPVANTKCPVTPLPVPRRMTLNVLNYRPWGTGDAGSSKVAIYATAANGLATGAPIYTSPAQSVTAGNKEITSISLTLEPGLYLMALGSYGWATTRMQPRSLNDLALADLYLPAIAGGPGGGDTAPGLFLNGFNETTGAFPTLTGAVSDYVAAPAGLSAWWYSIKATAA